MISYFSKQAAASRLWVRWVVIALLILPQPLYPGTLTVDEMTCTLVDAVTAANDDAAVGGCPAGSGADTISLTTDVLLTVADNSSDASNGLPVIRTDITLAGGAGLPSSETPLHCPFVFSRSPLAR